MRTGTYQIIGEWCLGTTGVGSLDFLPKIASDIREGFLVYFREIGIPDYFESVLHSSGTVL